MKISVLGTGMVGNAIGGKLIWLRLWGSFQIPNLNFHVVVSAKPRT